MTEEERYLISLGDNIKKLRIKSGISQKDLAHACDFETPNMRRIEAGKTNPTTKTLFKIAKALNTTIITLFDF